MLKPEFAEKKSLRLKFIKVGIGHPPAQTPMSAHMVLNPPLSCTVLSELAWWIVFLGLEWSIIVVLSHCKESLEQFDKDHAEMTILTTDFME